MQTALVFVYVAWQEMLNTLPTSFLPFPLFLSCISSFHPSRSFIFSIQPKICSQTFPSSTSSSLVQFFCWTAEDDGLREVEEGLVALLIWGISGRKGSEEKWRDICWHCSAAKWCNSVAKDHGWCSWVRVKWGTEEGTGCYWDVPHGPLWRIRPVSKLCTKYFILSILDLLSSIYNVNAVWEFLHFILAQIFSVSSYAFPSTVTK